MSWGAEPLAICHMTRGMCPEGLNHSLRIKNWHGVCVPSLGENKQITEETNHNVPIILICYLKIVMKIYSKLNVYGTGPGLMTS